MSAPACFDTTACPACGGLGRDENANYWCSTCDGSGVVQARLYCYEVASPEGSGGYTTTYEPPEPWVCWVLVIASDASEAKWKALRSPEFAKWRDEGLDPQRHPLTGITARRARCEHGICWGCDYDDEALADDGIACSKCWAESERTAALTGAPTGGGE